MIWKATTKVAFAVKDDMVYAWYCTTEGNTEDADAAVTITNYKTNVAKACVIDGVNKCFNNDQLDIVNEKRFNHKDTDPVTLWERAMTEIQAVLDKATDAADGITDEVLTGDAAAGLLATKVNSDFTDNCVETIWTGVVDTSPVDTASTKIYDDGLAQYTAADAYVDGAPADTVTDPNKVLANNFFKMMWKDTTQVAFGVRGLNVVLWYCNEKPAPTDAAAVVDNVGENCIVADAAGATSNKCYGDLALDKVNEYRNIHAADKLIYAADASTLIQTAIDAATFDALGDAEKLTAITPAADPYTDKCLIAMFTETDADKIADKSLSKDETAVNEWYAGKDKYDFVTNMDGGSQAAKDFVALVWRPNNKAGFGVNGKYAVAWLCNVDGLALPLAADGAALAVDK